MDEKLQAELVNMVHVTEEVITINGGDVATALVIATKEVNKIGEPVESLTASELLKVYNTLSNIAEYICA